MMDDTERQDIERLVADHDKYVSGWAPDLRAYRDAYADKFWDGVTRRGAASGTGPIRMPADFASHPVMAETNRVRVFVDSYRDGMFYKGLRALVRPPLVARGDVEELLGRDVEEGEGPRPTPSDQLSEVIRYWIGRADVEDAAEQAVDMALMYPEVGLKIGCDDPEGMHNPLDAVWLEALPPWETVFDREARSLRALRRIGHLYWCSWEEFSLKYDGLEKADFNLTARIDVLDSGVKAGAAGTEGVRILELLELDAEAKVGDKTVQGRFRVFALNAKEPMRVLKDGPAPFTDCDGRSIAHIIPVVLLNLPEFRLSGTPPVAGTYNINAEMNVARTILHSGMVKDADRKILWDATKITDEEVVEKLTSGADVEFVKVDAPGEGGLTGAFIPLDIPPLSRTLSDAMTVLEADWRATAGLSPLARGEALKYATAAEVHSHNDYSETTLGRLRKRLDKAILRVMRVFLRVLAATMDDAKSNGLVLTVDGKELTLKRTWLDEQWEVELADTASTPLADAQRRQELTQALPMLSEAYTLLKAGDPMGRALVRYIVDLYNLPPDFSPDTLLASQPAPPPPPPAPPAPVAPPPLPGGAGGAPGGGKVEAIVRALEQQAAPVVE